MALGQGDILPYERLHCAGVHAPGVVLVGFRDTLSPNQQDELDVIATIPGIDVATLRVPTGQ